MVEDLVSCRFKKHDWALINECKKKKKKKKKKINRGKKKK